MSDFKKAISKAIAESRSKKMRIIKTRAICTNCYKEFVAEEYVGDKSDVQKLIIMLERNVGSQLFHHMKDDSECKMIRDRDFKLKNILK
jgi:hypothetical protein